MTRRFWSTPDPAGGVVGAVVKPHDRGSAAWPCSTDPPERRQHDPGRTGGLTEDAGLCRFKEAWDAELATLPEFRTSSFHLVTGLLLPIWDRMGKGSLRIHRLQTDDGRRLLGRVLREEDLPAFHTALGLEAPKSTPEALWTSVLVNGASHALARGLRLRRSRVMAENRVELSVNGGSDIFSTLTGFGCMTEIIQYKRRAFIPVGAQGPAILAKVLERFPPV